MAIASRRPAVGFVHHSDQGSEYTAGAYIEVVQNNGGKMSLSAKATPTDNAHCESFMNTLKREELRHHRFRDIEHLREVVAAFAKRYNQKRLHSSLGYKSPADFERMHYAASKSHSVQAEPIVSKMGSS